MRNIIDCSDVLISSANILRKWMQDDQDTTRPIFEMFKTLQEMSREGKSMEEQGSVFKEFVEENGDAVAGMLSSCSLLGSHLANVTLYDGAN